MIFLKHFPFTLHWIVRKSIGSNIKTVLDLGCGDGDFTKDISDESWKITGVELYNDSINRAKKQGVYEEVIKGDITNLPDVISRKKFDAVISIQVLEHLKKEIGEITLNKWERLANKKIIVSTPVGFINYDRVEIAMKEENKLQKHLSGWQPEEFETRSYRVYGQGLRLIYGENGLVRKIHPFFWPLLILVGYFFAPLVFFFPSIGAYMVAVKDVRKNK